MEKALSKANGGKQRQLLHKKWTNGKFSVWKIKIFYSEVDNIRTKMENVELKCEKRKLEDQS